MPDQYRDLRRRVAVLILPAYIGIVIAAVVGVVAYQHEVDQRATADENAELARDQGACEVRNEFREVIGQLIVAAVGPSDAVSVGLTSPDSFAGLDAATQAYLEELQADLVEAQASNGSDGLTEFAESLDPENCDELGKEPR